MTVAASQPPSSPGAVVVACDESGSEGENVTAAGHRVFVHGSVDLDVGEAEFVLAEVRRLAPSQAPEYKADQILRPSAANAAAWLLDPAGPLAGRASVYLVDKSYFVVGKVIDLLVEEVKHARGEDLYDNFEARRWAWLLHRQGPRALGSDWQDLLAAFNSLMRLTQRKGSKTTVEEFFTVLDRVRFRSRRRDVEDVLRVLWQAQPHADDFQQRLQDDPEQAPSLDPLFAALPATIRFWHSQSRRPVHVVHDVQAALTPQRIADLIDIMGNPLPEFRRFAGPVSVVAVDQVTSKDDPRVQVADLLAGLARHAATAALTQDGAPAGAAVRPFVDLDSLWCDSGSWQALTGRQEPGT